MPQDKDGIGETACNGLIDLLEGRIEQPLSATLPVELVIRESCGGRRG